MKELTKEEKRMYATVNTLYKMACGFCREFENWGEPFECYAEIGGTNSVKLSMYTPYTMNMELIINPKNYLVDTIRCTLPFKEMENTHSNIDYMIIWWLLDMNERNPNKEYSRFWWHGLQVEFVYRNVYCRTSDYAKKVKYYSRRDKLATVRVTGSYIAGDRSGTENIPFDAD